MTLNKYEMYKTYYKDQYCDAVACIESVYPELLEDEIIYTCISKIRLITSLLDKRMEEIADLNTGDITSVRLPSKIHKVKIKGILE